MATARRVTARRAIMATTTTMAMGDDGNGETGNKVNNHGDGVKATTMGYDDDDDYNDDDNDDDDDHFLCINFKCTITVDC